MSKHTPGPWKIEDNANAGYDILSPYDNGWVAIVHGGIGNVEDNATLIASAPQTYDENIELKVINTELIKSLREIHLLALFVLPIDGYNITDPVLSALDEIATKADATIAKVADSIPL